MQHPELLKTIPDRMMPEVESVFRTTSHLLGMFEVYTSLVKTNAFLEAVLESDQVIVSVLEDIHMRSSAFVKDATQIGTQSHCIGTKDIMQQIMNNKSPSLPDMRASAYALISKSWALENDIPALCLISEIDVEVPFVASTTATTSSDVASDDLEGLGL